MMGELLEKSEKHNLVFRQQRPSLLTLSRRRLLSYRNQSIDFRSKSMDWFLYDNGLHHERVKSFIQLCHFHAMFCLGNIISMVFQREISKLPNFTSNIKRIQAN